jgi:hypothetical protein
VKCEEMKNHRITIIVFFLDKKRQEKKKSLTENKSQIFFILFSAKIEFLIILTVNNLILKTKKMVNNFITKKMIDKIKGWDFEEILQKVENEYTA